MSLPSGFTQVRDLVAAATSSRPELAPVSIVGMVTRLSVPIQQPNGPYILEFTVQDDFAAGSESSLRCKVIRGRKEKLPKLQAVGDFVLLFAFKMIAGPPAVIVTNPKFNSRVMVFPRDKIPIPELALSIQCGSTKLAYTTCDPGPFPTPAQQMAIVHLKKAAPSLDLQKRQQAADKTAPTPPSRALPSASKKQKLCNLKDMDLSKYYDLVGEVVKTFHADYTTVDLYVTDYTTNKDLFLYEDTDETDDFNYGPQKKWPGPFGQMTMAIRLYEPHASFARSNVREGDFVHLQNIHTKLSQAGKLEGAIHQDRRFLDKVCIRKCTRTEQTADLIKRKAAYENKYHRRKLSGHVVHSLPKKPSAKSSAKRKEEKKKKQRLQKELEQQELEEKAEERDVARAGINPHVVAGHVEKKLSSVAEIVHNPHRTTKTEIGTLHLPFVNCKYRARVRVIDMWPMKLWDFARSQSDPKYGDLGLSAEDREHYKDVFKWNFVLFVEDGDAPAGKTPDRLALNFGDMQGQYLLKMDACDLRQSPEKRKQLEQKMFILWGNLRERKVALLQEGIHLPLPTGDTRLQLQNKPFDCCIEEFGVPVGENRGDPKSWMRIHSLFNTTIMD